MLKTLRNALKVEEIRKRLLFTFLMMIVVRFGCELPIPGVNRSFIANWFANQSSDAFGFFDAITGGSFMQMSVFALNITPYITSSIIMQLLTIAIPKLEEMQKEGEDGRKKIAEYTRYLTVALALIESTAMAVGFGNRGYLEDFNALTVIATIVTLTAGSAFLMWIGERITEHGVGNGISIVLLINIISRIPDDFVSLYQRFMQNKGIGIAVLSGIIILVVIIGTVVFVVLLQGGTRTVSYTHLTPWGKPALGLKTRKKNKQSNKMIVRRRDGKNIK